ncbi:MAG: restriction endonuclease subunit S [Candidatus Obscuribacterales bacterium]|nr:restriction endonuclease subunit S [Syntrophobacteraceae bacterium]MDR3613011.1 restriction endonuclease subunit S [Candidatus Obscuribacterales bacterium]
MKSGWQTKKLAEVCQIKPPKSEARQRLSETDLVSFVPMEDLGINQKIFIPTQTKPLAEVAGSYTYFAEGDVLLAKITPCFENGKLGIASNLTNGIGFGSSEYIVFRPDKSINMDWLYYFLSREAFRVEGAAQMNGAVGHKRVAKEFIESYLIPVPPLREQQRIIGILDKAFNGIATAKANAEKNLQNGRALFESHLQSVFTQRGEGWVEKRLGEVAESISTGPFGTMLHKSDYVSGGIPLVNPMNIVDSKIVPSSKMMVSEETRDRLTSYVLKTGNIVIGRRGELGRCALVTEHETGWLCGTGSFFVRLSDSMDGEFFVVLFGSKQFKARLEASAVGTTMSSLNHGILDDLVLLVPPLAEQRKIMVKAHKLLSETQRLESIYQQKLATLEELKKSLLHQAFSGQL